MQMEFVPDRRFDSLTDAFTHILGQYASQANDQVWGETESGIAYPRELPRYLYRGECGSYPTTMDGGRRFELESAKDGFQLSPIDVTNLGKLIFDLSIRFTQDPYGLDKASAWALLQHYGLPTRIVDFTAHLGHAFTFAAAKLEQTGRVAVMPRVPSKAVQVVEFFAHHWAERAQRQAAYGIVMANELVDLKSEAARSSLGIKWYEFPILPSDQDFFREKYEKLLRLRDDPSAGFLRLHITEYVEARGKFSPALTGWLLNHVPVAPHCYLVSAFEEKEAVVYYRAADSLPSFSEDRERERTRRYWSLAHSDDSYERVTDFVWQPPGSIIADPRTYHPEA